VSGVSFGLRNGWLESEKIPTIDRDIGDQIKRHFPSRFFRPRGNLKTYGELLAATHGKKNNSGVAFCSLAGEQISASAKIASVSLELLSICRIRPAILQFFLAIGRLRMQLFGNSSRVSGLLACLGGRARSMEREIDIR
jgi:hypothetical protein